VKWEDTRVGLRVRVLTSRTNNKGRCEPAGTLGTISHRAKISVNDLLFVATDMRPRQRKPRIRLLRASEIERIDDQRPAPVQLDLLSEDTYEARIPVWHEPDADDRLD
jgi:hypothetical protein